MKVLVPSTLDLHLPFPDVYLYDPARPIPVEHHDAEALVVWGNSSEHLAQAARELPALRLVQTLSAGPDAVVAAGFDRGVMIASGRSLHDGTVAEHALALILALVRRLDVLGESQRQSEWNDEFASAQTRPDTKGLYTLDGADVLVWGFGSIAARLSPLLTALGARVTGVASSAGMRHGYDVIAASDLAARLPFVDLLVSILPGGPETEKAFGPRLLESMKPTALFVNVGRGSTVDEEALEAALRDGRLRAAALDVTRIEPLPSSSTLWGAPNLILTPHVAGNRPEGAQALVTTNIANLRSGLPIVNTVIRG